MSAPLPVLIAIDGSAHSQRAVAHVLSLAARGLAVDIHLLNVQPAVRGAAASLVSSRDLKDYHRDEGMLVLAESMRLVEAAGLTPRAHVSVGDAGETILAFAERLHCEQIVMGTRGHSAVANLLIGSVAHHVVLHTTLPVTLLR
jgi:nucleotide-binding universal stress UspA family protein